VLEVMQALVDVWGPQRAGIKLSPVHPYNNILESDPQALFSYLIDKLNHLPLAYLHLMQTGELPAGDQFANWPKNVVNTYGPLY
jgi:N-ethylmaleimide reductase